MEQESPDHHRMSSIVQQDNIVGGKDAGTVLKIKYEQQTSQKKSRSKLDDEETVYDGLSDSDYEYSMVSKEHLASVGKCKITKRMTKYPAIVTRTSG